MTKLHWIVYVFLLSLLSSLVYSQNRTQHSSASSPVSISSAQFLREKLCQCQEKSCMDKYTQDLVTLRNQVASLEHTNNTAHELKQYVKSAELCALRFYIQFYKSEIEVINKESEALKKNREPIVHLKPYRQAFIYKVADEFRQMCACATEHCATVQDAKVQEIISHAGALTDTEQYLIQNEAEINIRCNAAKLYTERMKKLQEAYNVRVLQPQQ